MLKELRLTNFKSFGKATLKFGPLTTIVGTNASGKSNLLDALRFLHAVRRGYTLAEIFGGKNAYGAQVWGGIRGGPNGAIKTGYNSFRIEVDFQVGEDDPSVIAYAVEVESDSKGPRVTHESLYCQNLMCFDSHPDSEQPSQNDLKFIYVKVAGDNQTEQFNSNQPVLTQWDRPPVHGKLNYPELWITVAAQATRNFIGEIRFLELDPKQMRLPSVSGATTLNESGDNLSSVLKSLDEHPELHGAFASWIRSLTPMDVERTEFADYPDGKVLALLVESGGRRVPLSGASDGTLRFLGILAAFFSPESPSLICFEEIETGFHPARLQLLKSLLDKETAKKRLQVLATTHSPGFVRLLSDLLDHVYLTYRVEGVPESRLKPVSEIPTLAEAIKNQDIASLYETGWMENTLFFEEGLPAPVVLEEPS